MALALDEVDLAVVDEYDESARVREQGLDIIPLLRDPIHLALPMDRDSGGSGVRLADLRDEPWIMDAETSAIYGAVLRACRRSGFEPTVRSHCKDYSVIIALVEAGLGAAFLPGLALRDRPIRATVIARGPAAGARRHGRRQAGASSPSRRGGDGGGAGRGRDRATMKSDLTIRVGPCA